MPAARPLFFALHLLTICRANSCQFVVPSEGCRSRGILSARYVTASEPCDVILSVAGLSIVARSDKLIFVDRVVRPNSLILSLVVGSMLLMNVGVSLGATSCSEVQLRSAEQSTELTAELCRPSGNGPFPAVVDLRPRSCEGPAGIPPGWEETVLPSWGYAVLAVDSFAARGLGPSACDDLKALSSRESIGDAYGGFQFLSSGHKIDRRRIVLLGFGGGVGTAVILAGTVEARDAFLYKASSGFAAFFAVAPYCNLRFVGLVPDLYAPARIFAGEKDDFDPADRCVELAGLLRNQGADLAVTVYPNARGGFDITPPDATQDLPDNSALHPGGMTISTHPQYAPWVKNYANCTITLKSVFDRIEPSSFGECMRHGAHFEENADTAAQFQSDLKRDLAVVLESKASR
jgi:dienelactone hydrolase